MKKYIIVVALLVLGLMVFYTYETKETLVYKKGLKLSDVVIYPSNEINFGSVSRHDTLTVELEIKNLTKETLIIDTVLSSCHCTILQNNKKEIAPEGFIKVKPIVLLKNVKKGNFETSVFVDGSFKNGLIEFKLKGNIKD